MASSSEAPCTCQYFLIQSDPLNKSLIRHYKLATSKRKFKKQSTLYQLYQNKLFKETWRNKREQVLYQFSYQQFPVLTHQGIQIRFHKGGINGKNNLFIIQKRHKSQITYKKGTHCYIQLELRHKKYLKRCKYSL